MAAYKVICWNCGVEVDDSFINIVPKFSGLLTIRMDLEPVKEIGPRTSATSLSTSKGTRP